MHNLNALNEKISFSNNTYIIKKGLNEDIFIDNIENNSTIIFEFDSNVKVLEYGISNKNINFVIECNANVTYLSINGVNMNRNASVESNGNFIYSSVNLLGTKDNFIVNLVGERANVESKVLTLAKEFDSSFVQHVNHNAKYTKSVIDNFGCAIENSNISFDTTGEIKNKMAKSDCRQLSKGIVIDNNSSVSSKPILLIEEYDVKAYHGASIGKMSDDELFYLMSRGLSKADAFKLILTGIIAPFVDSIFDEEIKNEINTEISILI